MLERIGAYHAENQDLQGLGREQLRVTSLPKLPKPAFDIALKKLAGSGQLVLDGAFVRLPSHEVQLAPEDRAAWEMVAPLLGEAQRFRPPRVRDLAAATGRAEKDLRRVLKRVGRMGWADEVAHDHFFLRSTVSEMTTIIANLSASAKDGSFSAAQFRDRVDNGRKVAIQILDFFDRHGVTLRKGDERRINRHRLDLFGAACQSADEPGGELSPVGRPDFKSVWGSEPVSGGFELPLSPANTARSFWPQNALARPTCPTMAGSPVCLVASSPGPPECDRSHTRPRETVLTYVESRRGHNERQSSWNNSVCPHSQSGVCTIRPREVYKSGAQASLRGPWLGSGANGSDGNGSITPSRGEFDAHHTTAPSSKPPIAFRGDVPM